MAKSKRKKPKHKPKNPPLSWIDKVLYVCVLVVGMLVSGMFVLSFQYILGVFWRADGAIAANKTATYYLALPFFLFIAVAMVFLIEKLTKNLSGFFKKSSSATKNRRHAKQYTEHEQEMRRFNRRILAGIVAVTFVLAAFGATGRWAFYKDGVKKYNCINRQTAAYNYADVTEFHMYEDSGFIISGRIPHHYDYLGISITFTDGKQVHLQTDVGCAPADLCAVYDLLPKTAQTKSDGSPEKFLNGYAENDPVAGAIRAMFAAGNS